MFKNLNQKFMEEISRIKKPEIFLGVARVLKVNLMADPKTPRDFTDVFDDCMAAFNQSPRARKKELLSILKQANEEKEGLTDGN